MNLIVIWTHLADDLSRSAHVRVQRGVTERPGAGGQRRSVHQAALPGDHAARHPVVSHSAVNWTPISD